MIKNYLFPKNHPNSYKLGNCLLILIMTDYIFTYIGINYLGEIVELNPLLIRFFNLPSILSYFIRLLHGTILVGIFRYLYIKGYRYHDLILKIAIGINIIVTFIHLRWVIILIVKTF